jgi:hypothetical protein
MVLLHGWMDVSASFQFLVDALRTEWDVYAPDWRGYGLSQWSGADSYWFRTTWATSMRCSSGSKPDHPVNLVGHSLGGNVAGLYAGVRPGRVAKFVNLEGFGMPETKAEQAPRRYARWMDELRVAPKLRTYPDYAALADRMQRNNARLTRERAEFLARHWGNESAGGVALAATPRTSSSMRTCIGVDEAFACWKQVHSAGIVGRRGGFRDAEAHRLVCRGARGAARRVSRLAVRYRTGCRAHAASRSARAGRATDRRIPATRRIAVAQYFLVHPVNPQRRLLRQAADIVRAGGLDRVSDRFLLRARLPDWRRKRRSRACGACAEWTTSTT